MEGQAATAAAGIVMPTVLAPRMTESALRRTFRLWRLRGSRPRQVTWKPERPLPKPAPRPSRRVGVDAGVGDDLAVDDDFEADGFVGGDAGPAGDEVGCGDVEDALEGLGYGRGEAGEAAEVAGDGADGCRW